MMWLFLACLPETVVFDSGDVTVPDADTGVDTNDALAGDWLSQGQDLSELFANAPFEYVRLDASFRQDGSYVVTGTTAEDEAYVFEGAWVADTTTSPGTITLTQTAPSNAVAEGIWEIEGNTLTYEVVQVSPDYGFTAPTPEAGFGSTGGPNMTAGINVQVYQRQ